MNRLDLERLSDAIAEALGSTISILVHTLCFLGAFALHLLGVEMQAILLIITTIVSLEAIYLAIFIQRSTLAQTRRMEEALGDLRQNTALLLDRVDVLLTRQEES